MKPSKTMLWTIAYTLGAIAVVSRFVPGGKAALFGA